MKFMCLGYIAATKFETMSENERTAMMEECWDYDDQLAEDGHLVAGQALQSPQAASTIRCASGAALVTDGPYAETKEFIGGVLVLEARDIEEAAELMSKHPSVNFGCPWEIRPIDEERLNRYPDVVPEVKKGTRKFACLGYVDDSFWQATSNADHQSRIEACHSFEEARRNDGQWLAGFGLLHPSLAKTVRPSGRKAIVTDGPFAETKEHLAGLIVIATKNIEDAVQIFAQHSGLRGAVEIRPIDEELIARWEARQNSIKARRRKRSQNAFA